MVTWSLKPESQNFLHLDVLRFIAAMGIVLYHFGGTLSGDFLGRPVDAGFHNLRLFVDLFFVVSGIVITHVYRDKMHAADEYYDFMIKRVARLWPLHIATLVAYCAIWAFATVTHFNVAEPERYDWSCALPNVFMAHSFGVCHRTTFNYVSWSISAELAAYLAFPLSLMLLRFSKIAPILIALSALALLSFFDPYWTERTWNFGAVRVIPGFLFGMGLYAFRSRLARLPFAAPLFWGALALFFVSLFVQAPTALYVALAYIIPLLGLAADQHPAGPTVQRLAVFGALTYSIYMLHPLWQTIVISAFGARLLHLSPLGLNLLVLVSFAGIIGAGYLSLVLFETPMRRLITKLAAPKRLLQPAKQNI